MSYTLLEELELAELYASNKDTQVIAITLDRSRKSVIAKLVQLKLYEPITKQTRALNKAELVRDIKAILEIDTDLSTLEKASKEALLAIHSALGAA